MNKKRSKNVSDVVSLPADVPSLPKKKKMKSAMKNAPQLRRGMRVSIKSTAFDGCIPGSWSKNKPEYTYGKLLGWRKGKRAAVLWDEDKVLIQSSIHSSVN